MSGQSMTERWASTLSNSGLWSALAATERDGRPAVVYQREALLAEIEERGLVKHWADHCPTAKRGDVLHVPEDEADCTTCSPAAIDASEPCCITSAQTRGAQHHVTCEEY